MSKGSDTTTTRSTAEPWSGVAPYLKAGFGDANDLYKQGAPDYYPDQTVAPLSGYTQGALDWQAQRAAAGSPLMNAGQQELTNTLSGQYLDQGNPYLQGAVDKATKPIIQQYQDVVMPGLDSTFSSAGRYGSGIHQDAAAKGYEGMMNAVGDTAGQMAYQNYGDERTNQMRGMMFAPQMAQSDYQDINQLGAAGSSIDAYNQQLINSDIQKFNYEQNAPQQWLSNYMGTLGLAPWGSTGTQTQPSPNIFTSAAGGALGGAALGSAFPGIGTAAGAIGGGIFGLLGGL